MRIRIKEIESIENARISYDSEAGALAVVLNNLNVKHNLIDWYPTIFDTDGNGQLVGIEVLVPKDKWVVTPGLSLPSNYLKGSVYLTEGEEEKTFYKTNETRSILCIQKEGSKPIKFIKNRRGSHCRRIRG